MKYHLSTNPVKMAQVKEACAFNYWLKNAKNKHLIGE
jgi:hypothetical protein